MQIQAAFVNIFDVVVYVINDDERFQYDTLSTYDTSSSVFEWLVKNEWMKGKDSTATLYELSKREKEEREEIVVLTD